MPHLKRVYLGDSSTYKLHRPPEEQRKTSHLVMSTPEVHGNIAKMPKCRVKGDMMRHSWSVNRFLAQGLDGWMQTRDQVNLVRPRSLLHSCVNNARKSLAGFMF